MTWWLPTDLLITQLILIVLRHFWYCLKGLIKGFQWLFRLSKLVEYSQSYGLNEVCDTLSSLLNSCPWVFLLHPEPTQLYTTVKQLRDFTSLTCSVHSCYYTSLSVVEGAINSLDLFNLLQSLLTQIWILLCLFFKQQVILQLLIHNKILFVFHTWSLWIITYTYMETIST